MRPIHLALIDKTRPVLVLTREPAREAMSSVTVAPITSTIKGLHTEVLVDAANGLEQLSAVSCDNVTTIPTTRLGRHLGFLHEAQEVALADAMTNAFDLHVEGLD